MSFYCKRIAVAALVAHSMLISAAVPALANDTDGQAIATRESIEQGDWIAFHLDPMLDEIAASGFIVSEVRAVRDGEYRNEGDKDKAVLCGEVNVATVTNPNWIPFAMVENAPLQLFLENPAATFCASNSVALHENDYFEVRLREKIASDGI